MLTLPVEYICELTINTKIPGTSLFDKNAYKTTVMYFKNDAHAELYAQKNHPNDTCKYNGLLAVEDEGKWIILDKLQYINNKPGEVVTVNGEKLILPDIRRETRLNQQCVFALTAEPTQIEVNKSRRQTETEAGYQLKTADFLKDATHFIYRGTTYLSMVKPRSEAVTLSPSPSINDTDTEHFLKKYAAMK